MFGKVNKNTVVLVAVVMCLMLAAAACSRKASVSTGESGTSDRKTEIATTTEKKTTEQETTAVVTTSEMATTIETTIETTVETTAETTVETTVETATTREETTRRPSHNHTGHIVVIDPGHQLSGDSSMEPDGPGSSQMKARVTSGTRGVATGITEYQLNLDIGLKLKKELKKRGYAVYMTREVNEVNISNKERAEYANSIDADISVRLHGNSFGDASVNGALTMAPSTANPYVGNIANDSQKLSQCIIDAYCQMTGMKNRGVSLSDTMTGINWCEMPVTILEMGYMSNQSDDTNMSDSDYQKKMVVGIANGIDAYFN